MIKVLIEFEDEEEMNRVLDKLGAKLAFKFRPRKNDDIEYLVQISN